MLQRIRLARPRQICNSQRHAARRLQAAYRLDTVDETVDDAKEVLTPLFVGFNALRSILKAHSSVEKKTKEERQARTTHGVLKAHFKDLAG